jgi:hypothetical protein
MNPCIEAVILKAKPAVISKSGRFTENLGPGVPDPWPLKRLAGLFIKLKSEIL